MAEGLQFDTREFEQALAEYRAATKKDTGYVVTRQARNWAIKTVRVLPKANRNSIYAVAEKEWWPKFIASLIRYKGFTWKTGGRRLKKGGRSKIQKHEVRGYYTEEEAQTVSKRLLSARTRSISFLKSGMAKVAKKLGDEKARIKKGLTMSGATVRQSSVSRAGVAHRVTEFTAFYFIGKSHRDRQGDARRKERIVYRAMMKALPKVIEDMKKHTAKVLRENAKKVSVR